MHLSTPMSAILSALIFNAIVIPCLIPIAMKGVKYKPLSVQKMLPRIWEYTALVVYWCRSSGIKLIDIIITPLLAMLGM